MEHRQLRTDRQDLRVDSSVRLVAQFVLEAGAKLRRPIRRDELVAGSVGRCCGRCPGCGRGRGVCHTGGPVSCDVVRHLDLRRQTRNARERPDVQHSAIRPCQRDVHPVHVQGKTIAVGQCVVGLCHRALGDGLHVFCRARTWPLRLCLNPHRDFGPPRVRDDPLRLGLGKIPAAAEEPDIARGVDDGSLGVPHDAIAIVRGRGAHGRRGLVRCVGVAHRAVAVGGRDCAEWRRIRPNPDSGRHLVLVLSGEDEALLLLVPLQGDTLDGGRRVLRQTSQNCSLFADVADRRGSSRGCRDLAFDSRVLGVLVDVLDRLRAKADDSFKWLDLVQVDTISVVSDGDVGLVVREIRRGAGLHQRGVSGGKSLVIQAQHNRVLAELLDAARALDDGHVAFDRLEGLASPVHRRLGVDDGDVHVLGRQRRFESLADCPCADFITVGHGALHVSRGSYDAFGRPPRGGVNIASLSDIPVDIL